MQRSLIRATWIASLSAPLLAQSTTRYDVDHLSRPINGTDGVALSRDGRWIFFNTGQAAAPGDTNGGIGDVYARDRLTGVNELVSQSSTSVVGDGTSWIVRSTPDGRFVLINSSATNLAVHPPTSWGQFYLRDRTLGTTSIVSVSSGGAPADGEIDVRADVSNDGTLIAFAAQGTALYANDPNLDGYDVFLHDTTSGTTTAVSVTPSGSTGNDQSSDCAISGDGRYVAFVSAASDLVSGDTGVDADLFVRDLSLGVTTRAVMAVGGGETGSSTYFFWLSFSDDGRWLAFTNGGDEITPGDTNGFSDVFLLDRSSSSLTLASAGLGGSGSDGYSFMGNLSGDGRYLTFWSYAENLVGGDSNGLGDCFLFDASIGALERASVSSTGAQGTTGGSPVGSYEPRLSDDGRFVVFQCDALGLVAGDSSGSPHAMVRDRLSSASPVSTYCTPKVNSSGCTPDLFSSGDPWASGPDSFVLLAANVLENKFGLFFWGLSAGSTSFGGGTLCVQLPAVRTGVQHSGDQGGSTCLGTYGFHFSQAYQAAQGLSAGQTIYAQCWSRDPGFIAPNNIGLTGGLTFTLAP